MFLSELSLSSVRLCSVCRSVSMYAFFRRRVFLACSRFLYQ